MVQRWSFNLFSANPSGASTPRGNGGGRGRGGHVFGSKSGTNTPSRGRGRGFDSPRGRGFDSPRGRGRGQPDDFRNRRRSDGIGSSPVNRSRAGAQVPPGTLSGLLYQERPLLRPIVFVPSVLTRVLFEQEEELIKPGVEDVGERKSNLLRKVNLTMNLGGTEQSDLPTADRVYRVFSGGNIPPIESDNDEEDEDGEEIEEVDFNELGTLFEKISTTNTTKISKSELAETTTIVEQSFTGFYNNTSSIHPPMTATDVDQLGMLVEETHTSENEPTNMNSEDSTMSAPPNEEGPLPNATTQPIIVDQPEPQSFHIDLEPTPVSATMAPENQLPSSLQNDDDDDDIIVYVAPHPRNISIQDVEPVPQAEPSSADVVDTSLFFTPYVSTVTMSAASASSSTYIPEPASISSFSFSFSQSTQGGKGTPAKTSARLYVPPVTTPRQAKAWKRKRGLTKRKRGKSFFGAFGAMREEAELHNGNPKRAERRRGDSDLDWGDTDDEDVHGVDVVEEGLQGILGSTKQGLDKGKGKESDVEDYEAEHGMEVDSDVDIATMQSFVGGLLGPDAGQHVTMDDIRDGEIMKMEDDQDLKADDSFSSEEEDVEDVFVADEAKLISESLNSEDELDDDTDDEEDQDEDQTPRTSFQARLELLRRRARSEKFADIDEDEIHLVNRNLTWADEDEAYIRKIEVRFFRFSLNYRMFTSRIGYGGRK